jgi:hypothetical protein
MQWRRDEAVIGVDTNHEMAPLVSQFGEQEAALTAA